LVVLRKTVLARAGALFCERILIMTKEEIKQVAKESDGNPQIISAIVQSLIRQAAVTVMNLRTTAIACSVPVRPHRSSTPLAKRLEKLVLEINRRTRHKAYS
jgi:hypothetical protein